MQTVLPWIQIISAAILVAMVLMQQSDSSLGAAFGGGDSGALHHTRRGFEKVLFYGTIVVAIVFVVSALLAIAFAL